MRLITLNTWVIAFFGLLMSFASNQAHATCSALTAAEMRQAHVWQGKPMIGRLYRTSRWYVQDGDSLKLSQGHRLRLGDINTPELATKKRAAQAYAELAKTRLRQQLAKDKDIYLKLLPTKKDRHGRWLVMLYDGHGNSMADFLVAQGLAYAISMNASRNQPCLWKQEAIARAQNTGLWGDALSQLHESKRLDGSNSGFLRLHGRISRISDSKKYWYFSLEGQIALKAAKTILLAQGLNQHDMQSWIGQQVSARGWLSWRQLSQVQHDKGYQSGIMNIYNLQMLEQYPP